MPRGSGWPRVATSFEFHRALKFEQEFDVTIRVAEISRRTIGYTCEISQGDRRIATGSLKIACVTKQPDGGMRSVEIPEEIALRFKPSDNPGLRPPTSDLV